MATSVEPGSWYECKSEFGMMIVCGDCARQAIADTVAGKFVGDEAVTLDNYTLIEDSDTEPYQCDGCLTQNPAYDEVEDE